MAAKVFAVPELLENILLNLDLKQLFAVQAVNKDFQGVVSGSKDLKRKMFLLANEDPTLEAMHLTLNPLFQERLPLISIFN